MMIKVDDKIIINPVDIKPKYILLESTWGIV